MAAEIKELFEGKWTAYKFENGDKLLEALGAGFVMRKLMSLINPGLVFEVEGDIITIKTTIGPKTHQDSFRLEEEFEVNPPPDEKPCTAISRWCDGKLKTVITPKYTMGKVRHLNREIINEELVQTLTVDGVTGIRYFKRS